MNNSILNIKVSYQTSAKSTYINKELSLSEVFNLIKSEKYKSKTEKLRTLLSRNKVDEYKKEKLSLDAVTFCGTFSKKRVKSNLSTYNNLIILDIDNIDLTLIDITKYKIINDPYILACWKSPSGQGIKGLFKIAMPNNFSMHFIDTYHKQAFSIVSEYFVENYNIILDKSGSDTSRLCFLSFDPEIIININCLAYLIDEIDLSASPVKTRKTKILPIPKKTDLDLFYNPIYRNNSYNRYRIKSIIRFLENRNISITESYGNWMKVGMAIANSFTYEIGLGYFLRLSKLDLKKYNESNCISFLQGCYKNRNGEINFKTIVYLAQKQGYNHSRKRKGSSETVLS